MAAGPGKTGVEIVERIADMGYDYIELPLAEMMALSDEEFAALKARVAASGIRCEVCNNFFPSQIRLTGPEAELAAVERYFTAALARAAALGVSVVVFGSAGAKRVPEGFPKSQAMEQLVQITKAIAPVAEKHGITIAIEPVRMPDCNIINTFREGVALAEQVDHPNIKVLVDFYHLVCEAESPDVLLTYGKDNLRHVHFSFPNIPEIDGTVNPANIRTLSEGELHARGWWRTYPTRREEWDYTPFLDALKAIGYDGRVSLEAPVTDFDRQAEAALCFLKENF